MTHGEGMLVQMSEKLIRVLPPAMLLLVIVNIMFLGMVGYLVSHNADARNAMLARVIDVCLQRTP